MYYQFAEGEVIVENTDVIMYTVGNSHKAPANIGIRVVGITNMGNFVSQYYEGDTVHWGRKVKRSQICSTNSTIVTRY